MHFLGNVLAAWGALGTFISVAGYYYSKKAANEVVRLRKSLGKQLRREHIAGKLKTCQQNIRQLLGIRGRSDRFQEVLAEVRAHCDALDRVTSTHRGITSEITRQLSQPRIDGDDVARAILEQVSMLIAAVEHESRSAELENSGV